jgi:hypothetical protein
LADIKARIEEARELVSHAQKTMVEIKERSVVFEPVILGSSENPLPRLNDSIIAPTNITIEYVIENAPYDGFIGPLNRVVLSSNNESIVRSYETEEESVLILPRNVIVDLGEGAAKEYFKEYALTGDLIRAGAFLEMYYTLDILGQEKVQQALGLNHEEIRRRYEESEEFIETSKIFNATNETQELGKNMYNGLTILGISYVIIRAVFSNTSKYMLAAAGGYVIMKVKKTIKYLKNDVSQGGKKEAGKNVVNNASRITSLSKQFRNWGNLSNVEKESLIKELIDVSDGIKTQDLVPAHPKKHLFMNKIEAEKELGKTVAFLKEMNPKKLAKSPPSLSFFDNEKVMLQSMREWFDVIQNNKEFKTMLKNSADRGKMKMTHHIPLNKNIGEGYTYDVSTKKVIPCKTVNGIKVYLQADQRGGFLIYNTVPTCN